MSARRARISARVTALALLASMLTLLPATQASAAVPATESDDVGMLDGLVRTIEVVGDRVHVGETDVVATSILPQHE